MPDVEDTATLAYIGLGANLGDAGITLFQAASELAAKPGISSLKLSRLYRSSPVDSSGPDYVNAVAALWTSLPPLVLLSTLQDIEQHHGRQRPYRNAPRTLDLDLLLYGDEAISLPDLTVPHPRMHERAFVLAPLNELAPGLVLTQGRVSDLLDACSNQFVEPLGNQAGTSGI